MKKIICSIALILCFCVCLSACTTTSTMAYTFIVDTGDKIKVTLDTSDGLKLSQEDGQFSVMQGDESILDGIFISNEMYDYYEVAITYDAKILDSSDGYIFFQIEGDAGLESDMLYKIPGTDTAVLLGSLEGEDSAKLAFEHLTFEKVS